MKNSNNPIDFLKLLVTPILACAICLLFLSSCDTDPSSIAGGNVGGNPGGPSALSVGNPPPASCLYANQVTLASTQPAQGCDIPVNTLQSATLTSPDTLQLEFGVLPDGNFPTVESLQYGSVDNDQGSTTAWTCTVSSVSSNGKTEIMDCQSPIDFAVYVDHSTSSPYSLADLSLTDGNCGALYENTGQVLTCGQDPIPTGSLTVDSATFPWLTTP